MLSWRQGSLPATLLKCLGQCEKHVWDTMGSIVFFWPSKNRKRVRELVISYEQISMYLISAATLICESDYSVINLLSVKELGIFL
jgi:hypothetical protein